MARTQFNRKQHGGLYDRGGADFWYHRPAEPHWYPEGTYNGDPITVLSPAEKAEYMAGYNDAKADGSQKDWG
jgi:hypothetical protein